MNLTSEGVRRILKKHGITAKKFRTERNNKIFDLYKKGKSVDKINKLTKLSSKTIINLLMKNGIYKPVKIVKERNKKIIDLYKNGENLRSISEKMKLHNNTIKYILNKNSVYKSSWLSKEGRIERNNKIINLYKKGINLKSIAVAMNVSDETVRLVLIKKGIHKFNTLIELKVILKVRNKKIVDLYKKGETMKNIADTMKLSNNSVRNVLIKNGIYIFKFKHKSKH
jgi:DNA-binding NarL/FixJ family response regulator